MRETSDASEKSGAKFLDAAFYVGPAKAAAEWRIAWKSMRPKNFEKKITAVIGKHKREKEPFH